MNEFDRAIERVRKAIAEYEAALKPRDDNDSATVVKAKSRAIGGLIFKSLGVAEQPDFLTALLERISKSKVTSPMSDWWANMMKGDK